VVYAQEYVGLITGGAAYAQSWPWLEGAGGVLRMEYASSGLFGIEKSGRQGRIGIIKALRLSQ